MDASRPSIFDSAYWDETLLNFSRATGIAVTLYAPDGAILVGPHLSTPIGECLMRADAWEPQGMAREAEGRLRLACRASGQMLTQTVENLFEACALPIRHRQTLIAVVVCGWNPYKFPDPVDSDRFARKLGVNPQEFWHILRLQQPLITQRLLLYGELLETLCAALVQRITNEIDAQEQARILQARGEASIEMSRARSLDEVMRSVEKGLQAMAPGSRFNLLMVTREGQLERVERPLESSRVESFHAGEVEHRKRIKIPIQSGDADLLGIVEVDVSEQINMQQFSSLGLAPLVAQMAVVMQKVQAFHELEQERVRLDRAIVELKRISRIRDEFLATISHELRTPLNSILGWSELLVTSAKLNSEEKTEALDTIRRAAVNQAHLIDDLLDMSRIMTGKLVMDQKLCNIATVLEQVVQSVRPAAHAKAIQLTMDLESAALPVFGDPMRLQQIFWNLLSNAVKFTGDHGRIDVGARRDGARIVIQCVDSGRGIKREFLPYVFERFSQEDGSSTRNHGGLGLGLAIVRHLVEMHGGEVSVDSKGEGFGTAFTVSFPLYTALSHERMGAEEPAFMPEQESLLSGIRILAVDDERPALRLLEHILKDAGAEVKGATAVQEALAIVGEWKPDLIISDLGMPGEDGFALLRQIRAMPEDAGGSIPVFALTAYTSHESKVRAVEMGFKKYFEKPLNRQQLLDSLRDFIVLR